MSCTAGNKGVPWIPPSFLAHWVCWTTAKHTYMHVLHTRVQSITCSCSTPFLGFHCALVPCSILSCPGAKPSGKHLGRAAHPLACKLCTWGKMLGKRKKLGISTGCKSCCPKQSQRMSGLMQHRAGNLFWGSHSHPILFPNIACQHHPRLHQQGKENLGHLLLVFPVAPFSVTLCILSFPSLIFGS